PSPREADVLVDHAGEAEGAEVGQRRAGGLDVRPLIEGQRVDLAPDGGVDPVAEVDRLLFVELARRLVEQGIDLRSADPGEVLLDVEGPVLSRLRGDVTRTVGADRKRLADEGE